MCTTLPNTGNRRAVRNFSQCHKATCRSKTCASDLANVCSTSNKPASGFVVWWLGGGFPFSLCKKSNKKHKSTHPLPIGGQPEQTHRAPDKKPRVPLEGCQRLVFQLGLFPFHKSDAHLSLAQKGVGNKRLTLWATELLFCLETKTKHRATRFWGFGLIPEQKRGSSYPHCLASKRQGRGFEAPRLPFASKEPPGKKMHFPR